MTPADFELLRELQVAKGCLLLNVPLPQSSDPRLMDAATVEWLSLLSDERGLWCLTNPTYSALQHMQMAVT